MYALMRSMRDRRLRIHDTNSEQLFERLYERLHEIAAASMSSESGGHTLQPTALIHEAYLRLSGEGEPAVEDTGHFLALSARAMRRVLLDHARRKKADKRGGGWLRVTLHDMPDASHAEVDVLDLDRVLERLAESSERAARIVELRFFGGMSVSDTAQSLGVSERTVYDDWAFARVWLARELDEDPA
jgi:RNA polymerase sigma factor (TIGR02999 family)